MIDTSAMKKLIKEYKQKANHKIANKPASTRYHSPAQFQ